MGRATTTLQTARDACGVVSGAASFAWTRVGGTKGGGQGARRKNGRDAHSCSPCR
jgi:hypothetical protein